MLYCIVLYSIIFSNAYCEEVRNVETRHNLKQQSLISNKHMGRKTTKQEHQSDISSPSRKACPRATYLPEGRGWAPSQARLAPNELPPGRGTGSENHGGADSSGGHGGADSSRGHGGADSSRDHGGADSSRGHGRADSSGGHGGADSSRGHGGADSSRGHGGAGSSGGHGGTGSSGCHGWAASVALASALGPATTARDV